MTAQLPAVQKPRELGLTAQPSLRLALGYRDEARKGAPVKTDYFVVSEGQEGEYAKAAAKFTKQFGEKPRAIPIGFPASLGATLDRRYLSFGSAKPGTPGMLKARGQTNLVLEGRAGGPDTLTVFPAEGAPHDVDITGADDPAAVELGIAAYTTFRFFIPDVLGLVGFAEIRSKGSRTTDNLYMRLWPLYANLGPLVSEVLNPTLVMRAARATYYDAKGQRHRSSYYALDLWIPDTKTEIRERMREHAELVRAVQPLGLPAGPPGGISDPQSWEEAVDHAQIEEDLSDLPVGDVAELGAGDDDVPFGPDEGWEAG